VYEDDFKKERSERENLSTQKERVTRELSDAKSTIAGLQRQLKQVNTVKYLVWITENKLTQEVEYISYSQLNRYNQ